MRILLVTQVFPPQKGGSGQWLWDLYRRLRAVDVAVAAASFPGAEAFDASSPLPTRRLPLRFSNWGLLDPRGTLHYARAFAGLNRLVSSERPDVIHCGKCLPEGLLALGMRRLRGVRFCCYAHGEELTLARASRELRHLSARVFRAASLVIANSQFTKGVLVDDWAVPPARVVVLHPGVDTTRFVPAPMNALVRDRLGWTGRQVILTVGALQKRKGQDMLIRALPAIRARCPNALYAVAGEGWERPYLEALVDECQVRDSVQFLGVLGDEALVECYQQCDLFALPNRQVGWDLEGFGIVLLEAQACGKPVISGLSGGTADALQPGMTGEMIACESPAPLAEAVTGLLTDTSRARQMGSRARDWVVERFDWGSLSQEATQIFLASVGR